MSTVHSIVKRKVTVFLQYFAIMCCTVAVVVDTFHSCLLFSANELVDFLLSRANCVQAMVLLHVQLL